MPLATATILVTNAVGLHARPSVKLTQLAKTFACTVEIAAAPDGPWADAKSPVKVMRVRVAQGAELHVRAEGADAQAATAAIVALVKAGFHEAQAQAPGDG